MKRAPRPSVTDHCVLRYLERSVKIDIEAVRTAIANRCAAAVAMGAKTLQTDDGLHFKFEGGTVVTVILANGDAR